MKNNDNYFKIGTNVNNMRDVVNSSSALSYIDPEQGGHPSLYKNFFSNELEKEETKSLETGTLLHTYMESPSDFIVSDVDKPTDSIASLTEHFYSNYLNLTEEDVELTKIPEDSDTKTYFSMLTTKVLESSDYTTEQFKIIIEAVERGRNDSGYNKNKKFGTVCKDILDKGVPYFKFLLRAENKFILQPSTKEKIDRCINGIKRNKAVQELINSSDYDIYKEKIILFDWLKLKWKSKIDQININLDKKLIQIIDYKTYGRGSVLHGFAPNPVNLNEFNHFQKYKYYRQLAVYREAVKNFIMELYPELHVADFKVSLYIIGVSTTFGEAIPFKVSGNWLYKGIEECKELSDRITFHIYNDIWDITMEEYKSETIWIK